MNLEKFFNQIYLFLTERKNKLDIIRFITDTQIELTRDEFLDIELLKKEIIELPCYELINKYRLLLVEFNNLRLEKQWSEIDKYDDIFKENKKTTRFSLDELEVYNLFSLSKNELEFFISKGMPFENDLYDGGLKFNQDEILYFMDLYHKTPF